jgi:hypothetical protein
VLTLVERLLAPVDSDVMLLVFVLTLVERLLAPVDSDVMLLVFVLTLVDRLLAPVDSDVMLLVLVLTLVDRLLASVESDVMLLVFVLTLVERLLTPVDSDVTSSHARLADACGNVDVLVELGGQVDAQATRRLHDRGAKLVSYCCGSEYVHAIEAILFDRPLWGFDLFVNREYDDIWMVPQVANISGGYFTTLRRRPARIVPFVWDPVFLEQRAASLSDQGCYAPRPGPRRISVMEPNLDVVKFCLYPALIADLAYRRNPEAIALLQVANAEGLATGSHEFQVAMRHLDLVRDHKAVFLGTHPTPDFLAQYTDVVVSHQWENPLNYLYLEVCWQGYPFVHNAAMCADLGYYYRGNDIDEGCERLLEALERHDADARGYRESQREAIARFLPSNPEVTKIYSGLLENVVRS